MITNYISCFGGGLIYTKNGKVIYSGAIKNGRRSGKGYAKQIDYEYLGMWEMDKFHGEGTYKDLQSGETYEGHFIMGEKCGFGRIIKDLKLIFEGEFYQNQKNGYGIEYDYIDPFAYRGQFKDNLRNGSGCVYINHKLYKGTFVNGVMHGEFKHEYEVVNYNYGKVFTLEISQNRDFQQNHLIETYNDDSTAYIGGMDSNGKRHGEGKFYTYGGLSGYEGDWKHGLKDGKGVYFTLTSIYVGYWENDTRKFGKWICHSPKNFCERNDGITFYDGPWLNNKPHGPGKFILDGIKYKGTFHNGYCVAIGEPLIKIEQ